MSPAASASSNRAKTWLTRACGVTSSMRFLPLFGLSPVDPARSSQQRYSSVSARANAARVGGQGGAEVRLTIDVVGHGFRASAARAFDRRRNRLMLGSVCNRLGDAPMFPPDLIARAAALIARYRAAGQMIATAESCTGGLIAGLLTEIPGSSAVLQRGFAAYSNAAQPETRAVLG